AAMLEEVTKPYTLVSGGAVARRRLLLTMAEVAESGVGSSAGHAARVSVLATALGRAIGLTLPDLEALDEAALLHDGGGLGLTLRELQHHPGRSEAIGERCGLSKPTLAAMRHHHERWDGKGYPDRLARSQIPVLARILAVADAWELMADTSSAQRARGL